ncbi:MAG: CheR family methyltransferase, partial [Nodosilinea sp.]
MTSSNSDNSSLSPSLDQSQGKEAGDVEQSDGAGLNQPTKPESGLSDESQRVDSFLTVGVGASAGGLEAFQTFFRHMDENSGMAFVLISHLAPDHDSLLSELLAKETQMRVLQVQAETQLQPNHVYVIPPNATLTVDNGILRLSTPLQARGHRAPINIFFRSLAEDQGENAVCIILSGTGSDGTIGMKSIKEFGGLAIAQDSETAKYDSMPRNAVMTGLVDYVLPVEAIPAKLIEYARHREGLQANLGEDGILPQAADYLEQICSLLRRRIGHDFGSYKQGTLLRRIQRRIQITQTNSVEAYVDYLQSDSEEVGLLFKDLLIGVTHFFRDPESFDALQQTVMARLVENSTPNKSIRIWVAGCSSGEEAYSLAMLLVEAMERQNVRSQVQIFATDIDDRALEKARHARYPESIAEQITPERLDRFFVKQDGLYQVSKHLREMCIFSQHSLISDPPFSRLDLISCRNLLIYFDTELQKRLIPLFHYALRESGYLFLGSSENLSAYSELFRAVDKPHRLFQRKLAIIPPQIDFP